MSLYVYAAIVVVVLLILLLLIVRMRRRKTANPKAAKQAPPRTRSAQAMNRGLGKAPNVTGSTPARSAATAAARESDSIWAKAPAQSEVLAVGAKGQMDQAPPLAKEPKGAEEPAFVEHSPDDEAQHDADDLWPMEETAAPAVEDQIEPVPVLQEIPVPEPEQTAEAPTHTESMADAETPAEAALATDATAETEVEPTVRVTPAAEAEATPEDEGPPAVESLRQPERAEEESEAPIEAIPPPAAIPVFASLSGFHGRRTPHDDPLRVVIADILRGWGDLNEDDTKRLDVFRSEKVLAAAESMEIPKDVKSNEYARKRLTQIRQYAAAPQIKAKIPDAGVAAATAATQTVEPAEEKSEHLERPWSAARPPEQPTVAPPAPETGTAFGEAPAESIEGRGGSSPLHMVKTADDVMALSPAERLEVVVFLEPPELAKVFAAADDERLKKSVIDILENIGSPASLEVLRACLDDPDPRIQIYALEAADRLLGT